MLDMNLYVCLGVAGEVVMGAYVRMCVCAYVHACMRAQGWWALGKLD